MSNHEWEEGRFTLPSAEYASFRKTIQQLDRSHKERVFTLTQEFWKSLTRKQQTDPEEYRSAVNAFLSRKHGVRDSCATDHLPAGAHRALEDAHALLHSKASPWSKQRSKPSRVVHADLGYPTNRTTYFRMGEASATFNAKDRTVVWVVGEGNHSVDRAHEEPLARAFFDRLDKVRWTHGTGGTIRYNSEYNEDEWGHQDGPVTNRGYGYIGIQQAPTVTATFQNAKGMWIKADVKFNRNGTVTAKAVKTAAPHSGAYGRGPNPLRAW